MKRIDFINRLFIALGSLGLINKFATNEIPRILKK